MNNIAFSILGHLALAAGIIGIFLPLVPTTPFLILAAFLYSKGSPRFESWLVNHQYLGKPVRDWRKNRAISNRIKIGVSLLLVTNIVVISMLSINPIAKICAISVIAGVMAFILTRESA